MILFHVTLFWLNYFLFSLFIIILDSNICNVWRWWYDRRWLRSKRIGNKRFFCYFFDDYFYTFLFVCKVYSSESASEPDVDLENQYYNSKALKEDTPQAALDSFRKVLELEQEKGEWGFRALKQMIKIHFKLVWLGHIQFYFLFFSLAI